MAESTINGQLIVWGDGELGQAGCKTPTVTVLGTITNSGDAAISTNGNDKSGAKIIIGEGAKISSDDIAIYLPSGNLTVNGGEITGATAIYQKSGSLEINGGSITGNGAKADYNFNGNGANATGDAIVVESCGYPNGTPTATINGGTLTSASGLQVGYYEKSEDAAFADVYAKNNTLTIPEDYTWVETETVGLYKLAENTYVAQNVQTGVKYTTLNGALAAANSGETVVPLTNITNEAYILVMAGVTLDLDGYDVTGATLFYVTGTLVDHGETRGRFSADAYYLGKSVGSEFPIYDSASGTYSLYAVEFRQYFPEEGYGYSFMMRRNDERVEAARMILKDTQVLGRVAAGIELRWSTGSGDNAQELHKTVTYADGMLIQCCNGYVAGNNKAYRITFTDLDSVESSVTATPMFIVYDANGAVMMTLEGVPWQVK